MCSCKAQGELHMLLDFSLLLSDRGSLSSAWVAGDGAGPGPAHGSAGSLALFCISDFQSTATARTASSVAMLHSRSRSHLWVSTTGRLLGLPNILQESTGELKHIRVFCRGNQLSFTCTCQLQKNDRAEREQSHTVPALSYQPRFPQHTALLHAGLPSAVPCTRSAQPAHSSHRLHTPQNMNGKGKDGTRFLPWMDPCAVPAGAALCKTETAPAPH